MWPKWCEQMVAGGPVTQLFEQRIGIALAVVWRTEYKMEEQLGAITVAHTKSMSQGPSSDTENVQC